MLPFLTETAVKAVKPAEKARKIYDERGLFLFVPPTGARLWRMRYQIGGREKLLALRRAFLRYLYDWTAASTITSTTVGPLSASDSRSAVVSSVACVTRRPMQP